MRLPSKAWLALAILLLDTGLALPAAAQEKLQTRAPQRETNLVVYGEDPCPEPADEQEIVVCARRPEQERYRVPAPLRRGEQLRETAWSSRAASWRRPSATQDPTAALLSAASARAAAPSSCCETGRTNGGA
jgi:hypothetical protein